MGEKEEQTPLLPHMTKSYVVKDKNKIKADKMKDVKGKTKDLTSIDRELENKVNKKFDWEREPWSRKMRTTSPRLRVKSPSSSVDIKSYLDQISNELKELKQMYQTKNEPVAPPYTLPVNNDTIERLVTHLDKLTSASHLMSQSSDRSCRFL